MKAADLRAHLADIIRDIQRGRIRLEYRNELLAIVESWQHTYYARASTISASPAGAMPIRPLPRACLLRASTRRSNCPSRGRRYFLVLQYSTLTS